MFRALKRLALLLFVLAAVVAAAFYLLYFRRPPLPATTPHARVVPSISTIPGVSACWIETGKTFSNFSFGSTAGSILVKHPAGDLLIDTGNSSHFDDEIRSYPFGTWLKLDSSRANSSRKSPCLNCCAALGKIPPNCAGPFSRTCIWTTPAV